MVVVVVVGEGAAFVEGTAARNCESSRVQAIDLGSFTSRLQAPLKRTSLPADSRPEPSNSRRPLLIARFKAAAGFY